MFCLSWRKHASAHGHAAAAAKGRANACACDVLMNLCCNSLAACIMQLEDLRGPWAGWFCVTFLFMETKKAFSIHDIMESRSCRRTRCKHLWINLWWNKSKCPTWLYRNQTQPWGGMCHASFLNWVWLNFAFVVRLWGKGHGQTDPTLLSLKLLIPQWATSLESSACPSRFVFRMWTYQMFPICDSDFVLK